MVPELSVAVPESEPLEEEAVSAPEAEEVLPAADASEAADDELPVPDAVLPESDEAVVPDAEDEPELPSEVEFFDEHADKASRERTSIHTVTFLKML